MRSRILTVILTGLVSILAIHLFVSALEGIRADATADDLYSLTEGTHQILEKMEKEGAEPVDITLFFSMTAGKTLPKFIKNFLTYERYLRSLLREYERASGGMVRVHFVDPVPDSDEAQDALDFGLDGKPVNQHGDLFFFGLVLQTQTGSKEVIEFLWPDRQESIEYEISKTLHSLLWTSSRRVGVLSSLELLGNADNPYLARMLQAQGKSPQDSWIIMRMLKESYEVQQIPSETDAIDPESYDAVVVVHPKDLPESAQWALDQYLARGGNAMILVDPYSMEDQPPQDPQKPWMAYQYKPASNLRRLFDAWGIEREEDRFSADFDLAVKRPVSQRGPAESIVVDLMYDSESLSETAGTGNPVMRGLASLRFFLPGCLKVEDREGIAVKPLITTTESGGTLKIMPGFGGKDLAYMDLSRPEKLRDALTPDKEPAVLACSIQGILPTAFPGGFRSGGGEGESGLQVPPASEEDRKAATVLLFADADFISDRMAFQKNFLGMVSLPNDNSKLFMNCIDYLVGASELMSVRAKHTIRRPFTRFDDIETEAEKETMDRERTLRAELKRFEEELREKQGGMTQANAALFQKKLQDDVDKLNEKIKDVNRELHEIRKSRRKALEREEAKVRFAVMGWMPSLVLLLGVGLWARRRLRERSAERS